MDLAKAYNAYLQSKENGISPGIDTYSNLLSLVAGLGEQGSGSGAPREHDPPSNIEAAFVVFSDMKKSGINLQESCYTAMIRCCCLNNRMADALALYEEMKERVLKEKEEAEKAEEEHEGETHETEPNAEGDIQGEEGEGETWTPPSPSRFVIKLRAFTHLLAGLARAGSADLCFHLHKEMTEMFQLFPSEREYLSILRACMANEEEGQGQRMEAQFYRYLELLMEDVLVPSQASWVLLREWFSAPSRGFQVSESGIESGGRVLCTEGQLQSIELDQPARLALLNQIECSALSRVREQEATGQVQRRKRRGGKLGDKTSLASPPSTDTETDGQIIKSKAQEEEKTQSSREKSRGKEDSGSRLEAQLQKWECFKSWLDKGRWRRGRVERVDSDQTKGVEGQSEETGESSSRKRSLTPPSFESSPPTLDASSHLNLKDVVVDGANVGYYKQNFLGAPSHVDYRQIDWLLRQLQKKGLAPLLILHCRHLHPSTLPPAAQPLVTAWREEGLLYSTPSGWNDDWFWLFAAVRLKCHVITNDEMRDHHFSMLSPRWFARWKERHQTHFSFSYWQAIPLPSSAPESKDNATQSEPPSKMGPSESVEISVSDSSETKEKEEKKEKEDRWRVAIFRFPRPYSHRSQRLKDGLTQQSISLSSPSPAGSAPSLPSSLSDDQNLNKKNKSEELHISEDQKESVELDHVWSEEFYFPCSENDKWLCVVKK